jgi:hypothetical protein
MADVGRELPLDHRVEAARSIFVIALSRYRRHIALEFPRHLGAHSLRLRRHLGAPYLGLLRFFFNHRRFMRSRRAERKDRSPCELMTSGPSALAHAARTRPVQPQKT